MYVEPKDSRQRCTKERLFASFERALQSKAVSDITVSEVCSDAGISRKTFYKYYSDPFALLLAMQDDLFAGLGQRLTKLPPDVYVISSDIIDFVAEHRVVAKAVFENRGEGNLIDRVLAYLHATYRKLGAGEPRHVRAGGGIPVPLRYLRLGGHRQALALPAPRSRSRRGQGAGREPVEADDAPRLRNTVRPGSGMARCAEALAPSHSRRRSYPRSFAGRAGLGARRYPGKPSRARR